MSTHSVPPGATAEAAVAAELERYHEELREWENYFRSLIPYSKTRSLAEYEIYERLIPVLSARDASDVPRIVVVTDVELDYDDLLAIIFLSEMHRLGAIKLAGLITNHGRAAERAKFLRTIMHLLGFGDIEVAVGTYGIDPYKDYHPGYYELKNETFEQQEWNKTRFRSGRSLLERLAKEVNNGAQPLTVLLISSLQDISEFFKSHAKDPQFLQRSFKKFVSQGGYEVSPEPDETGRYRISPLKGMANNDTNLSAAEHYTACLAEYGLPSDAWSREAAKAAPLEGSVFTEGALYGPIGTHLSWLYERQEFKFYWDPFNAPHRPRLNESWYLSTRCVMDPKSRQFAEWVKSPPPFHEILPLTKALAYDGCAAMGAVGDDVMRALGVMGDHVPIPEYNNKPHRIFGAFAGELGGVDGPQLSKVIRTFVFGALLNSKENAERLISSPTVKHIVEEYEIKPDVFRHQVPFLKRKKEIDGALEQQAITSQERETLQLELQKLKAEMIEVNGHIYSKLPEEPGGIPYELLYQDAKRLGREADTAAEAARADEESRQT